MPEALDGLGGRGTLLANLDRIVGLAQQEQKLKESGQSTMFDLFGDNVATPLPALDLVQSDASRAEQLSWERELLGVYVSEHPFRAAAVTLAKHTSALVTEITAEMDGREVIIAGMVQETRTRVTRAGKQFLVATVEDLSGVQEITVWGDVYEPTRELWEPGNILLMLVRVRERGDRLQISVNQVSLVQAADGSLSHEHFAIPSWLTDAVRSSAGVGVVSVEHHANGNGSPANGTAGNGAAPPMLESPQQERSLLRFWLHESDDADADERRLDSLIDGYRRAGDEPRLEIALSAQLDLQELSRRLRHLDQATDATSIVWARKRGQAEALLDQLQDRLADLAPGHSGLG